MSFIRLKYLLKLREGNTESNSTVLVLSSGSLKIKSDLTFGRNPLTYRYHQQVLKGDFVICLRDLDGVLLYGLSNYSGCISNLYYVFQIIQGNPLYFYYYISYLDIQNLFFQLSSGMRYTLSLYHFLNIKVAFPSLDKQQQVSIFLNQQSHLIQELLLKIDLLLKKLEDYQKALLYENFQIKSNLLISMKLKYLFKERVEFTKNTSIPCYSVTKKGIIPQLDTIAKTRKIENRKIIYPNDYIFNSRSSRFGSSGLASSIGSVASVNLVIYPTSSLITMDYMKYYFKSPLFIYQFYFLGKGIVDDLWSTHYEQLKELVLTLPSINQQLRISSYLKLKLKQLNEFKKCYSSLMDHLKEYQASLLYEIFQDLP